MKRSNSWSRIPMLVVSMLAPGVSKGVLASAILLGAVSSSYANSESGPEQTEIDVSTGYPCVRCAELMRNGEAPLTVGYALKDGGSVTVWLDKNGKQAHGQSYTREALPRGAEFVIDVSLSDGMFPIVIPQPAGAFNVRWARRQGARIETVEQQYGPDGMPVGEIVQLTPQESSLGNPR